MRLIIWFRQLRLRWKLLMMIMPLAIIPLFLVAIVVANIAITLAYEGVTRASNDDLKHMSNFTIDLLDGHYQQYEVYREEKDQAVRLKLRDFVDFAYKIVENQHNQYLDGHITLEDAKRFAQSGLKAASIGETGYIYAMSTKGQLFVHLTLEGENIYDSKDESGRYFIKEICELALKANPGDVLFSEYPWKNVMIGEIYPQQKMVAFRYFAEWDWIIAVGSYLDDLFNEKQFQDRAFAQLKDQIREKKVGETGFIYATDCSGSLVLHPSLEGQSVYTWLNAAGRQLLNDLCSEKSERGWLRSSWKK